MPNTFFVYLSKMLRTMIWYLLPYKDAYIALVKMRYIYISFFRRSPSETDRLQHTTFLHHLPRTSNGLVPTNAVLLSLVDTNWVQYTHSRSTQTPTKLSAPLYTCTDSLYVHVLHMKPCPCCLQSTNKHVNLISDENILVVVIVLVSMPWSTCCC